MKVLVVGLDGATWDLIKPWADSGLLPTIKYLMDNGSWGYLESSIPPVTFPAWKCYSTGKNPGKLDVFWWIRPDFKNKRIIPNSSIDFKAKEIWDYLSTVNISSCVIGMPTTYPPKKINGVLVSEFNPKDTGFVYPPELENEIKKKLKYKAIFEDFHGKKDIFEDRIKLIRQRFELCRFLQSRYDFDFINLVIFYIDNIQHFYWNDIPKLKHAWRLIDTEIDKLLKNIKPDILFFVSDHGFTSLKAMFNITIWLISNGYLTLKKKWMNTLAKLGILPYISRLAKNFVEILRFFKKEDYKTITKMAYDLIDWEKSRIIPLAEGPLYINPLAVKESEYDKLRNELITKLAKIKDPRTNEVIFEKIYTKEDLYSGKYLENAPDVILLPKEGYEIICSFSEPLWIFKPRQKGWEGIHDIHGIFLAYGKGIKKGYKIDGAKIYDMAPTILHILGLPIPNDMDGRVLMEIFEQDSEFAKRKPVYVDPSYYERREKDLIKSKIKKLKSKGKL